ncbi:homocysteine-responsive endoplasmic reticulum-resident ubiquitin-like domain member 2 protein [Cricetulus griseus]|uniref:Homocysteine-responsive endoplasmic reticulum-resident ubiquitin-like domain member 2 protein n=1 Tax=Cricetulus griseus TaxID=10029 RepID=G3HTI9_CRIGR|nr:homocysteine-responsive endoplasmic reticulum-resident ubiquitin-like domain member 2 protein [Cricetulus griseus]EGW10573.1 Homocysteine-responsive endoplasmic reticulum-resident ubiquitin-like domain member 2 protein [Cricetulus griseus]
MDQSGMEIPVTLIIKAPNQKYSDQTISCFLNWTVGKLKTHLSNVYPSKPLTKDQRLVYSGRLLPDHLQLKDILRKQDEYHMVHLVCTARSPPSSPKSSASREGPEALASSSISNSDHSDSTTPSLSQESLSLVAGSSEGLRQRTLPQAQTDPAQSRQFPYVIQGNVDHQFPGQAVPPGFPVYPALSPLQMLWWQQMYAHQYYMQYQAAVTAQATSSASPAQPAASPSLNLAHVPGEEPPPAPNLVAQENGPMNENVQMNAQGGPVLNEEDFNRDWLDWVYTFSRAAVLLSIVYFYSSFSRFIMVMGAMLLVYLHQAGWFPFRQEGGQQQVPNNVDVNNDGQNANNLELEEMERLMDDGLEDESGEDAGEDASAVQRPGLMASAWSFITTFFTSLIPEGPPQVAN